MVKQQRILYFVLIIAAAIALFIYNPWLLYFQNDDLVHIPLSRDAVLLQHNSFRPICDLSIMMDYAFYGKQAWGYHFTNLLIHIINSVLVYILSKNILKKYSGIIDSKNCAFTVAILFWLYINHSEAVFWILGRSAMIGMLFFLLACIFYLKRKSIFYFILSLLFAMLAWLSYESSIIIPLLFLIISYADISEKTSSWKKEIPRLSITIILFSVYVYLRFYFTGSFIGEYENGSLSKGFFVLFGNFSRLALRSWLPPSQNSVLLVICFSTLMLTIIFLISRFKNLTQKKMVVTLGIIWLISLLPYITLSIDTKGLESERFIYMPSFFVCLIIGIIFFQFNFYTRISLITIICLADLVILYFHARQYRFAGSVVKTTITAVDNLENKKTLFVEELPSENFGALIFRKGFVEGVTWLKNDNTVNNIIVLSQSSHDLPLQKNYSVLYSNNILLIKNSTFRDQLKPADVYFLYTDSLLYVINKK